MKQLFKNQYFYSLFTKGIITFLGISETVFINRYLGATLKGEFAYILNIVTIMVLILNLGIYQSYPFFKRKMTEDVTAKYFNIVIFQFLIYIIIGLIAASFLNNTSYLLIFALVPIMILGTQLSFIAMVEDINLRNKLTMGNELFYALSLFFIFIFAPQNILYVFALLALKDMAIIFSIIYKYKLKFSFRLLDFGLMKESIQFGIYPMITMLLITLNYKADVIILGFFVGFEQIGYYTIGVGLANIIFLVPDAFKDVLFSKTARDDSVGSLTLSIKINLYFSICIIGFIVIFGKQVIWLLYGTEFLPAYTVTVILILGIIPMIFFKLINTLFVAKGMQKKSFLILLFSAILNIIGNVVLIPSFGISGAAFASVLSYFFCGVIFVIYFLRMYSLKVTTLFILKKSELESLKEIMKRKG